MINKDFSDKDIAHMVDVDVDVIKNFRGGQNVQSENVRRIKKADGSNLHRGGDRDPGNIGNTDLRGKSGSQNNNHPSPGESTASEGSTEDPGAKRIEFVGGRKDMNKKEGSEAKEEDEYQCYNCDYTQGSPFTDCPKCGSSNTFEE